MASGLLSIPNTVILSLLIFALAPFALSDAYAQELPSLISPAPVQDEAQLQNATTPSHIVGAEQITVNPSALSSDTVTIALFDQTFTVTNEERISRSYGYDVWIGTNDSTEVLLIIDDSEITGTVETTSGRYFIASSPDITDIALEIDTLSLPPEHIHPPRATGQTHDAIDLQLINQLESAYIGGMDYREHRLTIDVYVVYTAEADTQFRKDNEDVGIQSGIGNAIENTNRAYSANRLPIVLNLVEVDNINRNDADMPRNMGNDLNNLENPTSRDFVRAVAVAERENADIMILVDNYNTGFKRPDERTPMDMGELAFGEGESFCAMASRSLPPVAAMSYGIVSQQCLAGQSLAYVIGYLHGAAPNEDYQDASISDRTHTTNPNDMFDYGHGHYYVGSVGTGPARSIMAQNHPSCDIPFDDRLRICERKRIWSDPYQEFFGTLQPAGNPDTRWNARVLFTTAPHIASLRGDAQGYDSTRPIGTVSVSPSGTIDRGDTITITATFNEDIHPGFPPNITFINGDLPITGTMTSTSDTVFTYSHTVRDSGSMQILFSNARDMFGNPVEKNPASGAVFTVSNSGRAPSPPTVPPDASFSARDNFNGNLSQWRLSGDSQWINRPPHEPVPDESITINQVLASSRCRDLCIATLGTTLITTEPLTISFDRFIDRRAFGNAGLYVEYSTDGSTWRELASFTGSANQNTDEWETTMLDLTIPEGSADIRLVAMSRSSSDRVEIDNFVAQRPAHAEPDITFNSTLDTPRTRIILSFTGDVSSASFAPSDFALSTGIITGVTDTSRNTKTLRVTAIPFDTPVLVTYTGQTLPIGDTYLRTNTASPTNVVTNPTPPVAITQPPQLTIEATGTQTPLTLVPPATTGGVAPITIQNDAPASFPLGNTLVSWTAVDSAGSRATATQLVTIQDTTDPVFTSTPPDIMQTSNVPLAVNYDKPEATDIFPVTVTCDRDSGYTFPVGTTTVTCTAADTNNNTAQISFRITIHTESDNIPPTLTVPDNITIDATGKLTRVSLGTPIATDNVDPRPVITNNAPDLFPVGTTRVVWTATDLAGNVANGTQDVTVRGPVPVQLRAPAGIAAGDGRIYVADRLTNTVHVFDRDIALTGQIGGSGLLSEPLSVALDPTRVFVPDFDNHRIRVFDHSGALMYAIGSKGTAAGQFDFPTAVDAANGMLYVADRSNYRVQVFESGGTFVNQFGADLRTDGAPMWPIGIVANSTHVLVSDRNDHTVKVFTTDGRHTGTIGERGNEPGQFRLPTGLELYEDRIYVADRNNHRIQVFDSSGTYVEQFGEFGTGAGQLDRPRDIAIYEDTIYVADSGNHRVQAITLPSDMTSDGG